MKKLMFGLACGTACGLFAAVTMPRIFGNGMVLQHGQTVPVWGTAIPGEVVNVSFAGQTVTAKAGTDGKWKLALKALDSSAEGRTFAVSSEAPGHAKSQLSFSNVVVGEVWFCSGQSNMEFTMSSRRKVKDWEREVAAARWPLIRHFNVDHKISKEPLDDVSAKWVDTTPETIPPQSAVAFFFGETLHKELNVPVGLINASWGGTRIEPWTPAGHPDDLWQLQNATSWGRPQDVPTVLWNGMVNGLVPFAIKGAIWYQGCANRNDGDVYLDKTVCLVRGWRREWGQGDFPYFLVQLAPYKYDNAKGTVLPILQEAQARVPARIPNTGYTVINDVGDVNDIHPTDKRTVGMRMADQVLDRVYGKFVRPWKTPTFKEYKVEGSTLRVTLNDAEGLKTRDGKAPTEFELRGVDGAWHPAKAEIRGSDVVLAAESVEVPVAMRFAAYNGSTPNLVNGAGLPVGPFRCGRQLRPGDAENLPELRDMACVQRYDIPVNCDFAKKAPKTLSSKEGVSRVAYLLELESTSGETKYVLAAMDAFSPKSDDLVLTDKIGARLVRKAVGNLTVRSNAALTRTLTNAEGGFIEFYNCNYAGKRQNTPAGGDDRKQDFNDTPMPQNRLGYGCLQIHNVSAKETVLAFNHFNNASVPCDVGIGTNRDPKGNPDWTFARNADGYRTRRMSVWVK
ncbi:MAG: sialate O-acetylesterase [bacterium]|nr:sialate O-acetylesterase [bacterium]